MFNFLSPTSAADTARPAWLPQHLLQLFPGAALSCVIAMAATFVSTLHGGPQLLYALFFGVAFHYLSQDPKAKPGIEFCSRNLLRLGVGLLGARLRGAVLDAFEDDSCVSSGLLAHTGVEGGCAAVAHAGALQELVAA